MPEPFSIDTIHSSKDTPKSPDKPSFPNLPPQPISQDIPPDISGVLDFSSATNPDDNKELKPLSPESSHSSSLYSPEELSSLISLAKEFTSLKKQADSLPSGSDKTNLLTKSLELLNQIKQDFNALKTSKEEEIKEARQKELLGNLPEQIKKAEELLGPENVLTHLDIEHPEYGFGFTIAETIPPIPESILSQLEKAKQLNEMLVLRVTQDNTTPITMQHILNTQYQKFHSHRAGKILYSQKSSDSPDLQDDCWYSKLNPDTKTRDNKLFFTTQKDLNNQPQIKLEWKLVSKEVIPETNTSINHHDKTLKAIEYFKQKGIIPPEENLLNPDNTINQEKLSFYFHRRTPLESMYDTILYFQKNHYQEESRLLKGVYDWGDTPSEEVSLGFVGFGSFDSGGADVSRNDPDFTWIHSGVCSSRT